jgi:hypothetical protein
MAHGEQIMKKDDVKIGGAYKAKITDKVVPIRIDRENARGGWDATNLVTNRPVRIKSAQKLRGEVKVPDAVRQEPKPQRTPVKKKMTAKDRAALRAQHKADQENARLSEERESSADGVTASERAMAKAAKPARSERTSLLDAAATVLADAPEPMDCKSMVERVLERGLWSPGRGGKTPHATLYSAILREIGKKGSDARFTKTDRGRFARSAGEA